MTPLPVLRFVVKTAGVVPGRRRRWKRQRDFLQPRLLLQKLQVFHGSAAAEVQQDHRQKLLGVPVPFVLPDSYESIDDFVKMEPVPKFDNGEKAGKRGDVLHLVRRLNLDFWSSVWHNGLRTSQVMAYCLVT